MYKQCDNQQTKVVSGYSISSISHSMLLLSVVYSINIIIIICSLYIIYKVENPSNSFWTYIKLIKTGNIILWKSFTIVSFILNTICLVFEVINLGIDEDKIYIFYFYMTYHYSFIGLFALIEIIAIHIITKKSKPQTKLCSRILLKLWHL